MIEYVEYPSAVCEIRESFKESAAVPCRVGVDIGNPYSILAFKLDDLRILIAGRNLEGARVNATLVQVGENEPVPSQGSCKISSAEMAITCEFKLAETTFYLTARF